MVILTQDGTAHRRPGRARAAALTAAGGVIEADLAVSPRSCGRGTTSRAGAGRRPGHGRVHPARRADSAAAERIGLRLADGGPTATAARHPGRP